MLIKNSRREFMKSAAGTSLAGIAAIAAAGSTAGSGTGAAPARRVDGLYVDEAQITHGRLFAARVAKRMCNSQRGS